MKEQQEKINHSHVEQNEELSKSEKADIKKIARLMAEMTVVQIEKARNKNIAIGLIIGSLVAIVVQLISHG